MQYGEFPSTFPEADQRLVRWACGAIEILDSKQPGQLECWLEALNMFAHRGKYLLQELAKPLSYLNARFARIIRQMLLAENPKSAIAHLTKWIDLHEAVPTSDWVPGRTPCSPEFKQLDEIRELIIDIANLWIVPCVTAAEEEESKSIKFVPHQYQHYSLSWLIQRTILDGHAGGAYFLDPGLGKTSTTLAWIKLLLQLGLAKKVLIVAPLRVVYSVWPKECEKWEQFKHLRCSIIHGDEEKRIAAINADADIYLINYESLDWLYKYLLEKKSLPFRTLVCDESDKLKTWGSNRTKAIRHLVPYFKRRLILTGTPQPNNLEDLFSQMYIVDLGESLGKVITKFRTRYFYLDMHYNHIPMAGADEAVSKLIQNACLRLSEKDHLDLPELVINDVWVDLPPKTLKAYKKFEREMFIEIDNGQEVIAVNAGTKYNLCRQLANGGIYDEDKRSIHIHDTKTETIKDIVDELWGKPALIVFQFTHDLERLQATFKDLPFINSKVSGKKSDLLIDQWNAGELPLLAVQPQSLSHGVNMQTGPGRDIIWMGLTDDLGVYLQLLKRIHRQGVTSQVRVHRILANRTVDVAVADRIESKDRSQTALLESLNRYRSSCRDI